MPRIARFFVKGEPAVYDAVSRTALDVNRTQIFTDEHRYSKVSWFLLFLHDTKGWFGIDPERVFCLSQSSQSLLTGILDPTIQRDSCPHSVVPLYTRRLQK